MSLATSATKLNDTAARPSSADWSASYSQFLSRTAAQSAATLNLYQQALMLVGQGKLEPTAFQSELPGFIQRHGGEYTNRLSEVGARFLGRLVELGGTYARRAAIREEESSPPDPPHFDPADPARWFEQCAEYAGKLNNRALKAYRTQLEEVAAGEKSPAEVQQRAMNEAGQVMPEIVQQMTQLYFDLLNDLNETRSRYEQEYFSRLLALASRPEREAPVALPISAPVGETAFASLSVANTTGAKLPVHFRHTDARRVDGVGPAFTPDLAVTPDMLELDAGAEQKILVSVRLQPHQFEQDHLYNCFLYIDGGETLRVEVQLQIHATPPTHPINDGLREK